MGRMRKRFAADKSRQGTFYSTVHWGKNIFSDIDNAVLAPGTARAKSMCAASRNPVVWDASTCPHYWNQLCEMFVSVPGSLMNEMHIPGIPSYEPQMNILEMKPRDPSPHVPWIKPCKRSTHVPRMKSREIPACPPDMKPTNEIQKWVPEWNRQRYLRVLQK